MTTYAIRLSGCDDGTKFVMDLDDTERALLERVAVLSRKNSDYQCQPRITVTLAEVSPR
jgi:hypothetical protein